MQRIELLAKTTATDQELGTFTALVSAWTTDREGDVIGRHAFDRTIAAWQRSGKKLPLLLDHSTEVVGTVDPASMKTTEEGLVVSGEIDRQGDQGQRVWRAIKGGSSGFSIGYAVDHFLPLKDGGRAMDQIDLLEISWTPRPMHPATRALSWKSTSPVDPFLETAADLLGAKDRPASVKAATPPLRIASFEC